MQSVPQVADALKAHHYVADRGLATTVYLGLKLGKPLFLEGEAGVGKTEIAKVLATILDTRLIRLQCYEGLDVNTAVYEWNYTRQMLQIRMSERGADPALLAGLDAAGKAHPDIAQEIFDAQFLIKRPLLQAIEDHLPQAPVLFELDLDALLAAPMPVCRDVSKFPPVIRDLAVVVDDAVPAQALVEAMLGDRPAMVQDLWLFDLYRGKGVEEGKKSLAFRVVMQDTSKTLTDADAEAAMAQLLQLLASCVGAKLRT